MKVSISFIAWSLFGLHLAVLAHRFELNCHLKVINKLSMEIGCFGGEILRHFGVYFGVFI